jgi:hypothetical protein
MLLLLSALASASTSSNEQPPTTTPTCQRVQHLMQTVTAPLHPTPFNNYLQTKTCSQTIITTTISRERITIIRRVTCRQRNMSVIKRPYKTSVVNRLLLIPLQICKKLLYKHEFIQLRSLEST